MARFFSWSLGLGFATLFASSALASAATAEPDWRALAVADVHAAHAALMENSPGTVPGVDRRFLAVLHQARARALHDAARVRNAEAYRFTLERFAHSFQDGHLFMQFSERPQTRWPGFLVGYRAGSIEVVETNEANEELRGAQLVICDGIPWRARANRILPTYHGPWSVPSSRRRVAPYLMLDQGNPAVPAAARCTFRTRRGKQTLALDWENISREDLRPRLALAQQTGAAASVGIRRVTGNGHWVAIPTLNALNPEAIAQLESLMKSIEADAPAVRASRYFVIDLRGNSGGNTFVALRVLNAIWGAGEVSKTFPKGLQAQWRASPANKEYLNSVRPVLSRLFGDRSPAFRALDQAADGIDAATAANRPIYVNPDEYSVLTTLGPQPAHRVSARAFLLTDASCASSCLNLVDMMLKLPDVVHVGDETSADTNYLENRPSPLPSGRASLHVPMKRYVNRERAANASYRPRYIWHGSMADSAGLERWIATDLAGRD